MALNRKFFDILKTRPRPELLPLDRPELLPLEPAPGSAKLRSTDARVAFGIRPIITPLNLSATNSMTSASATATTLIATTMML